MVSAVIGQITLNVDVVEFQKMADSAAEAVPDAPRLKRRFGFLTRALRRPADHLFDSRAPPGCVHQRSIGGTGKRAHGHTRKVSMKQFEVVPEVTALTRGPVEAAGTSNAY